PAQRVFISYRREDSAAYAGRLYDAMVARFGERNVFMDLDLAPGVDFVERITEVVSACQVLIEVIGPTWATVKDDEGQIRIADSEDFVRLELEIALRRPEVTVIPVLVGGAQMPDRRDLPPELGALARRNALELSDRRWRYDAGQLISALEEVLAETTAVHVVPPSADAAVAAQASREPAPTDRAQIPAAAPDRVGAAEWLRRHGRLLAGVAALVVAAAVFAIVALGGGSAGGDLTNLKFERFTGHAFTVDVPADWRLTINNQTNGGVKQTKLEDPAGEGTVEVDQEVAEANMSPEERMKQAVQMRSGDRGYELISTEPQDVHGRATQLFWYEHGEPIGPSTVATYFFDAGGVGWRTRAVVAKRAGDSAESAREISNKMATTLEPR
ncbi:MAG: toll/interleukin-1 receptor domain-containing protein, partial [Acidobacteriota bacterium]